MTLEAQTKKSIPMWWLWIEAEGTLTGKPFVTSVRYEKRRIHYQRDLFGSFSAYSRSFHQGFIGSMSATYFRLLCALCAKMVDGESKIENVKIYLNGKRVSAGTLRRLGFI
ncbi:hypothetical protein [Inoviridae sp.]|nr:hypothetical protein [Inoviridae sp.]